MTTLFITGIDTDVGKSVACGLLAKTLLEHGISLYTQKLIETGCLQGVSNDLLVHEKIVGKRFNDQSADLHCPYRFGTPVSPHLAAERDGQEIDEAYLKEQMLELSKMADHLLVEGAGGLYVPLNAKKMLVDFVVDNSLPIILVTSARLGSINHTLLTLQECRSKSIDVRAVIYNYYPAVPDWMLESTRQTLKGYLKNNFSKALWLDLMSSKDVFYFSEKQMEYLLG